MAVCVSRLLATRYHELRIHTHCQWYILIAIGAGERLFRIMESSLRCTSQCQHWVFDICIYFALRKYTSATLHMCSVWINVGDRSTPRVCSTNLPPTIEITTLFDRHFILLQTPAKVVMSIFLIRCVCVIQLRVTRSRDSDNPHTLSIIPFGSNPRGSDNPEYWNTSFDAQHSVSIERATCAGALFCWRKRVWHYTWFGADRSRN